jgi:hypothetical protein
LSFSGSSYLRYDKRVTRVQAREDLTASEQAVAARDEELRTKDQANQQLLGDLRVRMP